MINLTVTNRLNNMSDMIQERVGFQKKRSLIENAEQDRLEMAKPYGSANLTARPTFIKTKLRAKKAIERISAAMEGKPKKSMKDIRSMSSINMGKRESAESYLPMSMGKHLRAESYSVIPAARRSLNKTSSVYDMPR